MKYFLRAICLVLAVSVVLAAPAIAGRWDTDTSEKAVDKAAPEVKPEAKSEAAPAASEPAPAKPAEAPAPEPAPAPAKPSFSPLDAGKVKAAVSEYVTGDMTLKGGEFYFNDTSTKAAKLWKLRKPQVHPDVRAVDAETSVVCVDMTSGKGDSKKLLDVDFWVKKGADKALKVTGIRVHKVGKKEQYIFDENNQVAPVPKKSRKKARRAAAS